MKCDSGSTFRTLQPACEKRAPLLLIAVGERSKNSVPLGREVSGDLLIASANEMLEQRSPRLPRGRWQPAQIEDRMQQSVESRITGHWIAAPRRPPVVDQQIEGFERFDVMPPQRRNEYRIAGCQLCRHRSRKRLAEQREALEIGLVEPHQAHRRTGGREVEGPDIEVRDLLRRKQREASPAGGDARDVVPFIQMSGRRDGIAE